VQFQIVDRNRPMTTDRQNYWLTWSTSLLFFVAFYTLLVPLPLYLVEIGLPDWQIGVIMGAFGVASLIGRPLAGLAADRIGYRTVMLAGMTALLVGVSGLSLTANPTILFVLRLLQALGYVAFTTASNALVVALAAPGERKSLLTRFGAAANVAMTLTPATINVLLPLLKLQGALWVSSLFALISSGLALRVRMPPPAKSEQLAPGRRLTIPRSVLLPIVLAMICGVGFGAFLQFLPLLTERRGGLASGPLFAVYGAGIALTRMIIARWMDEGDQRLILRFSFLLVTLGLFLFAVGHAWSILALAALCVAAGAGMQTGLLMNLHVEALPPAARGSAIAFYYLGFDLGIGGGAWLLAPALQRWGIGGLYLCAAAISLLGALMVQFVRQKSPVGEPVSVTTPAR
jgi:predicted MFS family arabinose efflux permease